MSLRQSIRAALETCLTTVSGLPAERSWENVSFQPPDPGTAWVEATVSWGPSIAITTGPSPTYRHEGLFAVDLHYPLGNGPALADAAADAVIAAFPVSLALLQSGVTTRIRFARRTGPGFRENAWFKAPVTIGWRTFSLTP